MSGTLAALANNVTWEGTRLRRSRRAWLLLIPLAAGPIGSAIADLYLRVPSVATAQVLGLLITAGLSSLVVLDLTALAVGEDLALRAHLLTFALPEPRRSGLAGRLLVAAGGPVAGFAAGGGLVMALAPRLVMMSPNSAGPILVPLHLYLGLFGVLVLLAGVTASAAVVTRSAAQALVAGVLAGVTCAGVGSWLLLDRALTVVFPIALAAVGGALTVWAVVRYGSLES